MFKLYPKNKPGDIIHLAVYDCFEGEVKLLERKRKSIHIEIVDVCMCYSCQVQLQPGERMWIEKELIYTGKLSLKDRFVLWKRRHGYKITLAKRRIRKKLPF